MIRVEGFSKIYGERPAVENLSFEAPAGEILGLVGPNGAGKTTTLRAMSGVIPLTSGKISIAGHDIEREPIAAKQQLAIVADDPNLFDSLTVWEHLLFVANVYRLEDWEQRARDLLRDFEIADREKTLADELSRGMKQKVAVSCALLHEPKVLLLDEPLTGLDPRGIRTLFDALERNAREGSTVIISSHLLGQIEDMCSRFLILHQGRALHCGTPEEIKAQLPPEAADASLEEIFFLATEGAGVENSGDATAADSSHSDNGSNE